MTTKKAKQKSRRKKYTVEFPVSISVMASNSESALDLAKALAKKMDLPLPENPRLIIRDGKGGHTILVKG